MIGLERFVDETAVDADLSSATLEFAARQRGLEVSRSGRAMVLVRLGNELIPFTGINGPDSSAVSREICSCYDGLLHLVAAHGVPVPRYSTFTVQQTDEALSFVRQAGWPLVIGPARSAGRVMRRVHDEAEFRAAWRDCIRAYGGRATTRLVLVAEHVQGETLHVVVVDGRVVSVAHLGSANVEGDGQKSIAELIAWKNAVRSENPYLRQFPIPDDPSQLNGLAGRALGDVPAAGELVVLHSSPSTLTGFDVVDVTDRMKPKIEPLAVAAVRAIPGLAYAGVEIVTPSGLDNSISSSDRSVVVNVSWSPPLSGQFPTHGARRDIAGAIIDHYLNNPRWLVAQQTSHEARATDGSAPMWLGQGHGGQ